MFTEYKTKEVGIVPKANNIMYKSCLGILIFCTQRAINVHTKILHDNRATVYIN